MTKKISQLLAGSGDAGACHQLVGHLLQLGYKVANFFSKGFCQKKHQHHTNKHQHRHQEQPPFPAWLQSDNQLIEKDWSPSSTSTPHWSTLTSTTKRNLCLSNIWSQVSEGFDGQTRTELLEAGNELDRVRILKTISCQSFTTCSTSPQLWEQQIPIYVDTHYLWKQKIPKYVDTD